MIVTLLVIIFSPFLIAIPLQRNTEIFHGNEILPDKYSLDTENTGLRNGVVPSSEAHSRNSRETEVSPSQYELLSGISAINKTIPNSSKKQLSKAAVTPDKLARSKKTGNKGAKRGGDPDPNINADPFSPTLENGLSESEAGSLSSGLALSTISDPFASSNVSIYTTSFPNVGSSLSTHNSRKPPDAHGSGDGLFASEGALYRALYVVFALVLLVLLYFFIKFAMYAACTVPYSAYRNAFFIYFIVLIQRIRIPYM